MTPKDQLKEVALMLGLPADSKDVIWMLAVYIKENNEELNELRKKLAIAEVAVEELAEELQKVRPKQVTEH